MELSKWFSFLIVIKESIKLLPKNGKLMALITLLSMALSTASYLLFSFTLKSLIIDILVTFTDAFTPDPTSSEPDPLSYNQTQVSFTPYPGSYTPDLTRPVGELDHLGKDYALLLAVLFVFFLTSSVLSLVSMVATTLVSAMSYKDKTFSLKDLCLGIARKLKKTIVTGFYVALHFTGYIFLVVSLVVPPLMYFSPLSIVVVVLIALAGLIFYLHLLVVWILAILVSAIEESTYGMDALAKAAVLVKGKRFCGIMIILFFKVLVWVLLQGYRIVLGKKALANPIVYGAFVASFTILVKILLVVAYTVLYFQCKKSHDEEIDLRGSIEYTELPTTYPTEKSQA